MGLKLEDPEKTFSSGYWQNLFHLMKEAQLGTPALLLMEIHVHVPHWLYIPYWTNIIF